MKLAGKYNDLILGREELIMLEIEVSGDKLKKEMLN
jgi:hypothetical protein